MGNVGSRKDPRVQYNRKYYYYYYFFKIKTKEKKNFFNSFSRLIFCVPFCVSISALFLLYRDWESGNCHRPSYNTQLPSQMTHHQRLVCAQPANGITGCKWHAHFGSRIALFSSVKSFFFPSLFHDVRNDKRSIPHKKKKRKERLSRSSPSLLSSTEKKKTCLMQMCACGLFFSSISLWSLGFFIPIVSNMVDMLNCVWPVPLNNHFYAIATIRWKSTTPTLG